MPSDLDRARVPCRRRSDAIAARGDGDHERRFEFVSISDDGDQANNDNDAASISADGRYVAFASLAENLVPNDTNFSSDVFVRDRKTDTIERVSVGPLGVEGDGNSGMLSGLGRRRHQPRRPLRRVRVGGFEFRPGRHPRHGGRVRARPADAHDRAHQPGRRRASRGRLDRAIDQRGRPVRGVPVVLRSAGAGRQPELRRPCLRGRSADERHRTGGRGQRRRARRWRRAPRPDQRDGRVVAFDTSAGNLVPGDGDQAFDVFVHDRKAGKTEGISTRTGRPTPSPARAS